MKDPQRLFNGRIGTLTPDQQETLKAFKSQLSEKQLLDEQRHDDNLLCRFLRARKFDLTKTMEMFVASEKWRKEENVDDIYENFKFTELPEVSKVYPRFYHQIDKLGRPIYIEILGPLNMDTLLSLTTMDRLKKNFIYEYEKVSRLRFPACTKLKGELVETSLSILDMKNCSVMQAMKIKDVLKIIIDVGQNYYPETMGVMMIINAPWLFDAIWNFLKLWLDEVTVSKIKIVKAGRDPMPMLLELVDASNLPKIIGGECECAEGCESGDRGPWN